MLSLQLKSFVRSDTFMRHFVVYAFPCLFIWSFYFLAFYPGMMSRDSLEQWQPVINLQFGDWHPASLSFLYWLLSRIWFSPAIVCLVQMLTLAAVFTYGMVQLEKRGLPAWAAILMVLFFSLFPLNGFYVNTLFKDVPFTIAYLLAYIYVWKVVDTRGEWLDQAKNITWFALTLSFIWVIRHNGILTVITTIGGLLYFYPRFFKKLGLLTLIILTLVFLVKGPLYKALNVKGRFYGIEMIITHQIGAVINSGAELKPEEKAFVEKVLPMSVWQQKYNAFLIDPLIFNAHFNHFYTFLYPDSVQKQYIGVWFSIVSRNIPAVLRHQKRVTDLVWNTGLQKDSYNYTIHPLIDSNHLGLKMQSVLPNLKRGLIRFHNFAYTNPYLFAIFLRPATYVYAGFILLLLIYLFTRKKETILLALPFVTIVAGVFLTIPAQHTRYLYPCFLLTPFLAAHLLIILKKQWRPAIKAQRPVLAKQAA